MKNSITIIPGMAATYHIGSDQYWMVVTEVISPKLIKMVHVLDELENKFINKNGIMMIPMEYLESYKTSVRDDWYTPQTYSLRKNGEWVKRGEKTEYGFFTFGVGKNYSDPEF